jgi:hypothetical protein
VLVPTSRGEKIRGQVLSEAAKQLQKGLSIDDVFCAGVSWSPKRSFRPRRPSQSARERQKDPDGEVVANGSTVRLQIHS